MKQKRIALALCTAMIAGILLAGCGGSAASQPPAQAAQPQALQITQTWQSDGVISSGEYSKYQKIGDLDVYTRVEGDSVMFGLKAQTTGWLALGIDPEDKMKGANILMCYMKDGQAKVVEMNSTGTYGPHPAFAEQGDTISPQTVSGSQKDGTTVIEFKRKLDPADSKHKPLKNGENKVIWAIGDTPDPAAKHSRRGAGVLILQ